MITRSTAVGVAFLACQICSSAKPLPAEMAPWFSPTEEFAGKFGDYRSPLKFYDGGEVKTAADWARRRAEIREKWFEFIGKWPGLLESPKVEIIEESQREGILQRKVRLEVAPDYHVEAYILLPSLNGPFPAVVVPFYDAKSGAGLGKDLRDFGIHLTKRGFVSLSLGWPHPRRQGGTEEEKTMQELSFLAYVAANCHTALTNVSAATRTTGAS